MNVQILGIFFHVITQILEYFYPTDPVFKSAYQFQYVWSYHVVLDYEQCSWLNCYHSTIA